ncbi:hypothetical protein JNB71_14855 [Rhizobium herbae]|uniref:Uncharacterized protein n=1 Tax=Rhizobium herbae TaxID=508661 RepID=A0ABS7HEA9_9HYPH|nr:hypothetical protein [Rhizobium herbae]MBW9064603.1 hypothetical protein [Rhizobium herbae]
MNHAFTGKPLRLDVPFEDAASVASEAVLARDPAVVDSDFVHDGDGDHAPEARLEVRTPTTVLSKFLRP